MTPAEHRAEFDRLVRLCYTAEPLSDEVLPDITISGGERFANILSAAQVHATLALAPAAAPLPSRKPKPAHRVEVFDVELHHLVVTTTGSPGTTSGLVLYQPHTDWSTLLDDPAQVRLLADTLTAHADRMENR